MTAKERKPYIVTYPLVIKVWAFDEADALREASQSLNIGWPVAQVSNATVNREAASL